MRRRFLTAAVLTMFAGTTSIAQTVAPAAPTAAPQAASPATAPSAPLPSAEELLKRHIAAVGGEAALAAVKSITTKGGIDMSAAGVKGTSVTHMSEPNRVVMSMDLVGVGLAQTGFDGTTGWSMDKIQGPRLLAGKELEQLKRNATFPPELNLLKDYEHVTVTGLKPFAGSDAFEVQADGKAGAVTVYFDPTTGLMKGMKNLTESPLGAVPVETVMLEYKPFDGPGGPIKMAVRSEMTMMNQKTILTVDEVSFDAIDEKAFALPTEVTALAAQAKAAASKDTPTNVSGDQKPNSTPDPKPAADPTKKP